MDSNIIPLHQPVNEPQVFNSERFGQLRTLIIDGKLWFVAAEVAIALGYASAKDMVRSLDDKYRGRRLMPTPSGDQEMTIISESGLWKAIAQRQTGRMVDDERKAFIEAFQDWVFEDVLPQIRANGSYGQPKELTRSDLAQMVLDAEKEKQAIAQQLEQAQPAIQYHHRYIANDDVMTVTNFAAGYGMSAQQVYELMDAKGLLKKLHFDRWSEKKKQVVREHEWRFRSGSTHPRAHWFDLRPQHNAPRHNNGQVRQTLYIRAIHAPELAEFLGLTALPVQDELTQEAMA